VASIKQQHATINQRLVATVDGMIREARLGQRVWEGNDPLFGVSNGATQKIIKIIYTMALISCHLVDLHTTIWQVWAYMTV
jgi:hypothetical protein